MSSVFLEKFLSSLKGKGWKQKEIAELLGITQQHASRLYHGATPSIEIVIKLADYFNVTTDEVLGRENRRDKAA
jgi:transcriptional regulator with XRE-family HTH domain